MRVNLLTLGSGIDQELGLTPLGLQEFSQELEGSGLEWRGHLVGIIELADSPVPQLLAPLRDIVRMGSTVLGDRGGQLRL